VKRRVLLLLALVAGAVQAAGTFEEVKRRGYLRCGVIPNAPGLATVDQQGRHVGFNIDHCNTIAAAVFGDIKVEYVPVTPSNVFTVLRTGGIDVFPDGATWTYTRDTVLGLDYIGVHMYAGQGFVVRRRSGITRVAQLDGATICVAQGTTNETNLAEHFDLHGLRYEALTYVDVEQALHAYLAERCDAFTTEQATIATRIAAVPRGEEHLILAELISKEPFGAVVRENESHWKDVVFWAFNARVAAEELGVSQANVDGMRATSKNPEVQRLLGVTGGIGRNLGLADDWAYQIIKRVGNYADVWERNLAPLGVERGPNRLARDGGLMYAMPFR
jgi:general L-amino acid transport system substrate-binding protein